MVGVQKKVCEETCVRTSQAERPWKNAKTGVN